MSLWMILANFWKELTITYSSRKLWTLYECLCQTCGHLVLSKYNLIYFTWFPTVLNIAGWRVSVPQHISRGSIFEIFSHLASRRLQNGMYFMG